MNFKRFLAFSCVLLLQGSFARAAEGLALAIVYDTSGSMRENVRDARGRTTAKYLVANRALQGIASTLEKFARSEEGRSVPIHAALYTFREQGAQVAIPMGPFSAKTFSDFAANFSRPGGDTPLGNALLTAGKQVLASPMSRKHVLVITDGLNTAGPDPSKTLPTLQQGARTQSTDLSVHFVAFDIDAKVFEPVKKLGATVVGAANEQQLNTQLDFILKRKILLEDEEPAPQKQP